MRDLTTKDMYYKKAKAISYEKGKRNKAEVVEYIAIHNTGNDGDTAKNNVDYFAKGNDRKAGAHFFVDQNGDIGRSIPMELEARAVGGAGKGTMYDVVTNYNSISIELCDIVNKEPSEEMVESLIDLIRFIYKYCPNIKGIVRHYDVTGKLCPARMVDNKKWNEFLTRIMLTSISK